ncbi:nuclear transport factor 2 family protein [Halostreptopolyspora alba]|uniref:Nuclear transport factor 2 family protein n=1 Tax=Halostreptopolyspora alba TaxID=2487137 RepID=A0A3N0ED00_9ACTN|nr:nuclear transport factor 2 family protein [Nocardiopsaceae bacterium YIM 96095]
MSAEARLRLLLDRAEICDLLVRFARRLDERDFVGYAALFTDDCRLRLPGTEHRGRRGLAEFVAADLGRYHRTQHLSTNHQVEIHDGDGGDTASSRSYLYAVHLRSADDPSDWWSVGGWYDNTYRREGGRWLLHTVDVTPVWLDEGKRRATNAG